MIMKITKDRKTSTTSHRIVRIIDLALVCCFAASFYIHFIGPIHLELGLVKFSASDLNRTFILMLACWVIRYTIVILTRPDISHNRMAWYYLGIGSIAGATLLLEIAMTRIFAVAFFNHYAHLIISTALFGFGFSGVFLAIFPGLKKFNFDKLLTTLSIGFALSTIITLKVVISVPLQFGNMEEQAIQFLYLSVYYLVIAIPFFFSGMVVALLLSNIPEKVNTLYFSDLIGAGIGCFLVLPMVPLLGAPGAVIFSAMLGIIAASCFGKLAGKSFIVLNIILFIALAALLPLRDSHFRVVVHEGKRSFNQHEAAGEIELTRWGPVSRIDVAKYDPYKIIWIDGGSNQSFIHPFHGNVSLLKPKRQAGIVYQLIPNPDVLIVGPSAGEEVLYALSYKANSITGVELDPVICDIMQNEYAPFAGYIYNQPTSKLINDEGRSYIRRSTKKYDIIQQINNASPAAIASGALNVSETYLITVEAFHDYLDHLKDGGYIYIKRYGAIRLATVAAQALRERGVEHPEEQIIIMEDPLHKVGGGQFYLKNGSFTEEELAVFGRDVYREHLMYGPKALNIQHDKYPEYAELISNPDAWKKYYKIGINMFPVTDDNPFFNHFTKFAQFNRKTVPEEFKPIFDLVYGDSDLALLIILGEAAFLSLIFIILPLYLFKRSGLRAAGKFQFLAYFFSLGLAFILIEIVLIQKFTLFMGNPTYSVTVVLFSLLIAAGCGSFLSGAFKNVPKQALMTVIPLILILCWVDISFGPVIFNTFLGHSMAGRILISILMIFPLGLVMGMPFPLGITLVNHSSNQRLIPWVWGINGYATVIGSVLCVILALSFGFKAVIYFACAIYLFGMAAVLTIKS
ncbi:hypothetical protein CSB45_07890 [candidate division KSB3 bacterium]|uniref:SAM-dependent methyltransferase n=1 Tax=candidate division KSB3 bacterium TaxID=2044937 RepID=A0A2G6E6N2_9BACT|nr:MAG: hypothetical protein CSB45_07890 [candidate division KSB3 bacterium]PIE29950.1 MAG: hypothetical protein CSA57_06590 [candidate division KSB3 bacterium]